MYWVVLLASQLVHAVTEMPECTNDPTATSCCTQAVFNQVVKAQTLNYLFRLHYKATNVNLNGETVEFDCEHWTTEVPEGTTLSAAKAKELKAKLAARATAKRTGLSMSCNNKRAYYAYIKDSTAKLQPGEIPAKVGGCRPDLIRFEKEWKARRAAKKGQAKDDPSAGASVPVPDGEDMREDDEIEDEPLMKKKLVHVASTSLVFYLDSVSHQYGHFETSD